MDVKNKLWNIGKTFLMTTALLVPMQSGGFEKMMTGRYEAYMVLFVCLYVLLQKGKSHYPNRRYVVCFSILSVVSGILLTTSASFSACGSLALITENGWYMARALFKIAGYSLVSWELGRLLLCASIGSKFRCSKWNDRWTRLFGRKHCWLLLGGLIFLLWLPYFVISYPGNMTLDARDEIAQVLQQKEDSWTYQTVLHDNPDDNAINNHQPVVYTCLVGGSVAIGRMMGNANIGIAFVSLLQMITAIIVFVYMISVMRKYHIPPAYEAASTVFFALFPIFPMFAVTITKDMLFAVVFLWMAVELWQLIMMIKKEQWSRLHGILFIVSGLILCLLRNNGIYILLAEILVFLFFLRGKMKWRMIATTAVPIAIYFVVFLRILLPLFEIENGSKREMLCVPFQQVARYAKEWGDEGLTEEDVDALDKVLRFDGDMEVLASRYIGFYADPVKAHFNPATTADDLNRFFSVWLKMVKNHPMTAVEATMHNNFLLSSSNGSGKIIYVNQIANNPDKNWYGVTETATFAGIRSVLEYALSGMGKLPFFGVLFSIGCYDWVLLAVAMVLLARRRYDAFAIVALYVLCAATLVLGPIIYMRYAIPWILALPLFGGVLMTNRTKGLDRQNG